jgi:hypothetical protein
MQPTKKLTRVFRDLIVLIEEEAARNPAFAERLEEITSGPPSRKSKRFSKRHVAAHVGGPPDVMAAIQEKGETEFRFWLRSLDLSTLKTIVKVNGFDPAKASQRWTDPDKFVGLIAEQTNARLRRGSGFLPTRASDTP